MTQNVSYVVVALGVVALGFALLQLRSGGTAELKPYLLAAAALLFGGALLTLFTGKPWSPGQTLAPGFVLGGFAVLAAAAAPARLALAGAEEERHRYFWAALQVSAATLGLGVLLVVTPQQITDAMGGFALGAITAGLVVTGGALLGLSGDNEDTAWGAENATLVAVTLAVATYLAALHRGPSGLREWTPLPGLLAAVLAVGLNVRAIFAREGGAGWLFTLLGVYLPLGLIAWVSAYHLHGTPSFLLAVAAGVGVGSLAALLEPPPVAEPLPGPAFARRWPLRMDVGLVAALVTLGAALLAFRTLHGYGVALAALGIAVVLTSLPVRHADIARERPLIRGTLVLLLLLAIYRIFKDRYGDGISTDPDSHYYYVAMILGAALPALLGGSVSQWMRDVWSGDSSVAGQSGTRSRALSVILRIGLAGLGALTAPLLVWILLSDVAQGAFLVGLAVGTAFLLSGHLSGWSQGTGAPERCLARLLALGMALSAMQFTHLLEPLADLTRTQRIEILAAVAAVALVGVMLTALRERRMAPVV